MEHDRPGKYAALLLKIV